MSTDHEVDPPRVAVLGLGAMGLPMARRLAASHTVQAFDVSQTRRRLAAEADEDGSRGPLQVHDTARAAATDADVVLIAVRDAEQLQDVLWGDDGVAAALAPGSAVVLTSTVGIEAVRRVAERLGEQGLRLVDAPVSGGPVRAGNGELLVTVGAEPEAYAATELVLRALASTLTWVGRRPGDGQSMKTVNQLLCGVHIAAAAEALALARSLGLDPELALETLQAGAAASFMLGDRGPRMLAAQEEVEEVEVRSRLDIFVKDLGIVGDASKAAGLATPVAAAAEQLFRLGTAHGLAARDDSAVITVLTGGEH